MKRGASCILCLSVAAIPQPAMRISTSSVVSGVQLGVDLRAPASQCKGATRGSFMSVGHRDASPATTACRGLTEPREVERVGLFRASIAPDAARPG